MFKHTIVLFVLSPIFILQSVAVYAEKPPRKTWRHSCYVYRDMDRNGVFNMGDRPYGRLAIRIDRPDGSSASRRSNIDGFANFDVSLGDKKAHIYEAGKYHLKAIFPKGWQSTSNMHEQEYEFVGKANAGGKLVPRNTCRPIGVAPVLSIEGRFNPPNGSSYEGYQVIAVDPKGEEYNLTYDAEGNFSIIGGQGNWQLRILDNGDNVVYSRGFEVEHGAVKLSDINLNLEHANSFGETYQEVQFDDLLISDSLFEIPFGYGELNWLNWIATHNRFYKGAGYVNHTISSEYIAYNSSGVPGLIWSEGKPFDFVGTYIGVAWPRGEEDEVTIKAWKNGELAYQDRLHLTDNGPVYFSAEYKQINKMEISHGNYERIVLDNFQFRK